MRYLIAIVLTLFLSSAFAQRIIPSRQIIKGTPNYILKYDSDSLLQVSRLEDSSWIQTDSLWIVSTDGDTTIFVPGVILDTDMFLDSLRWTDANDTLTAYIKDKVGSIVDSFQVLINGFAGSVHTHLEADITDLNHYTSTDFNTDFATKTSDDLPQGITNLYDDDIDSIAIVDDSLIIGEGAVILKQDLSPYLDNTDSQTLTYIKNGQFDTITISGGNSIASHDSVVDVTGDWPGTFDGQDGSFYLDNTDNQSLSLIPDSLSISGGSGVSYAALADSLNAGDNLGNHIATQDLKLGVNKAVFGSTDQYSIEFGTNAVHTISSGNFSFIGGYVRVGAGRGYGLEGSVNTLLNPDSYGFDLYGNLAPASNQAYFATYGRSSSATSGIVRGLDLGGLTLGSTGLGFGAGVGSANFQPLAINYTINNSGVQSGVATGIFLNATETALNSMTHNLIDLQVGGGSRFKVLNTGQLQASQYPGTFTGTVDKLLAVDASGYVIITDESGDDDIDSISIVNDSLYIGEGATILRQDLSQFLDNTDAQTLSFSPPNLSITGGNSVDISGIDTDTQLSEEQVEDFVGGMLAGTETLITVDYDDAGGMINYVVQANLSNYTNDAGFLTSEVDGSVSNELQTFDSLSYQNLSTGIDTFIFSLSQDAQINKVVMQDSFLNNTGDWIGTFDGQDGSFYLDNVTTDLSIGTHNATSLQILSSDGTDVTLPLATSAGGTNLSGLMSPTQVDDIIANNAKVSNTDNQVFDISALNGNNLELSLSGDGEATKVIDLSQFLDNTRTDSAFWNDTDDSLELFIKNVAGAWVDSVKVKITGFAATSHVHAAADITSGTFADALIAQSNVTQHQAAIDHDALTNFVANEHIDWTLASQGTIHATNYVDNNTQLTTEQVQDIIGGFLADGTGTYTGISFTYQDGTDDADIAIDHDAALNFVTNEHIDHTAVTLTAGSGLTGGGDISANRTFTLDLTNVNGWTAQQYFPIQTLTDQPTITWDGNTQQVGKVTLTANRTLANMTNIQPGAIYTLYFIQSTGGHTITFGTNYLFSGGAPTLSTGAGDIDKMVCGAISATQLLCDCAFNYE